tara:strand:+ start:1516 stop:2085 length:570 start_codon:yes stop_codon:yes gene_type:complete
MCFSFEFSLFTGIFSSCVSLFLLQKKLNVKDRNKVLFLLIFSSMQFADAILWYIKMKKNTINYVVTSFIIPLILILQVLFNVYIVNKNTNIFVTLFVICLSIYGIIKLHGYSEGKCNSKYSSPIWGSSEFTFIEMFVFLIFISYPDFYKFLTGLILVLFVRFYFNSGYGSLWCSAANLAAIKYLFDYAL